MKENILKFVNEITLYTGTYGRKKCTCSCIGCTQERYGRMHEDYQGTLEQIDIIIEKLPNLKRAYILGNPDISVDTEFCNLAAKRFIERGIKVQFSTSGFNGVETLKILLNGIEPKNIEYISYSVDTTDEEKLRYLKGSNKIELKKIEEAVRYCIQNNITTKIQPTLWEINQDDYEDIINYFYDKCNIRWFTFHCGSFESCDTKSPLRHIKPEKWKEISKNILQIAEEKNIKLKVPKIFFKEEELNEYSKNFSPNCINGKCGIQIWMQKNGLKATFCPLLAETNPEKIIFDIEKESPKLLEAHKNCPICDRFIDEDLKKESIDGKGREFITDNGKFYTACRYSKA